MSVVNKCFKTILLACLLCFLHENGSAQHLTKSQKDTSKKMIAVPDLVGLQLEDAKILLGEYGIGIGAIVGPADSSYFYIYRQYPSTYKKNGTINYIRKGQLVDVWIGKEKVSQSTRHRNGKTYANDYLDNIDSIPNEYQRIKVKNY